ncbi:MAG TPA: 7,8-didemethyl-8-hydroxy-5-deazariboflavin synthase CofG, partial [Nitrososphaera sp.]|nr:7,8-didemethyl-8-hydroxy-5-deazariboflavin synthase CofG [Nitrososphaera sp.]
MAKSFISIGQHQTPVKLIADSAGLQDYALEDSIERTKAQELIAECNTADLVHLAGKIRDKTKPGQMITYSRKVFINLVNLCRDTCSYCTYKKVPGDSAVSLMNPPQVLAIAEAGKRLHCTEALFVTGERPEQKYTEASDWLRSLGHASTVEYISEMCDLVLEKTGLLPHTNAGSMTRKEMSLLKDNNASLGVMLESASERLMGKGMPHEGAPSKNPKVRLKTLESAGELKIPMTTGLLVGIGETTDELVDSLYAIKEIHRKHGHIQEVIMQNFAPKPDTEMALSKPPSSDYFLRAVAMARIIMPEMNIQVPPNLTPEIFGRYIDAGINDWGGISPVTIDYVNPEFPWPDISAVNRVTEEKGKKLRARLPAYPEFVKGGFITSDRLQNAITLLADQSGLV